MYSMKIPGRVVGGIVVGGSVVGGIVVGGRVVGGIHEKKWITKPADDGTAI